MRKKPRKTNARPLALESLESRLTMSGFGMRAPEVEWGGAMFRGELRNGELPAAFESQGESEVEFHGAFKFDAMSFDAFAFEDQSERIPVGPEYRNSTWGGSSWTPVICCHGELGGSDFSENYFPGSSAFLASGLGGRGGLTFVDRSVKEPAEGEFSAPNSISNNSLSSPIVVVLDRPESASFSVIVLTPIVSNLARPEALSGSAGRETAGSSVTNRGTTATETAGRVAAAQDSLNRGSTGQESLVRDTLARDTIVRETPNRFGTSNSVTSSSGTSINSTSGLAGGNNGSGAGRTAESLVVGAFGGWSSSSNSLGSARDGVRSANDTNWSLDLLSSTNFATSVLAGSRLSTGLDTEASRGRDAHSGANRLDAYDPFADGEGWWTEDSDGASESAAGRQAEQGFDRNATRDSRSQGAERGKSVVRRETIRGADGVMVRRRMRDNSPSNGSQSEEKAAPAEAQTDGMVALAHRVRGRRLTGAPAPTVGSANNALNSQVASVDVGQRPWVRVGASAARNQSFEIGLSGSNAARSVNWALPASEAPSTSLTSHVSSSETTSSSDGDSDGAAEAETSPAASSWWMKLCVGLMTLSVILVRRRSRRASRQADVNGSVVPSAKSDA